MGDAPPRLHLRYCVSPFAQAWPTKPIRIIVPYPPGGTSDILARAIGQKLTERWGQPVVVENKPGANGNVGADFVAKSPPDGYTMLLADIGALAISPSVYPNLPFDPVKDFAPVTMVAYSPHILAVHPSVPAKNVKELVALAKAKPGKLNFAHLRHRRRAAPRGRRVRAAHRRSSGPTSRTRAARRRSPTWSAGQAHVLFNGMLATYPPVKGGKLRSLAVSSAKRVRSFRTCRRSPNTASRASRPARARASSRRPERRRDIVDEAARRMRKILAHAGDEGPAGRAGRRGARRHRPSSSAAFIAARRRAGRRSSRRPASRRSERREDLRRGRSRLSQSRASRRPPIHLDAPRAQAIVDATDGCAAGPYGKLVDDPTAHGEWSVRWPRGDGGAASRLGDEAFTRRFRRTARRRRMMLWQ